MYVCVCHAVTEADVHRCVTEGAGSAKEIRAARGMQPACGSCTKRLHALVGQSGRRRAPAQACAEAVNTPVATAPVKPDLTSDTGSVRIDAAA